MVVEEKKNPVCLISSFCPNFASAVISVTFSSSISPSTQFHILISLPAPVIYISSKLSRRWSVLEVFSCAIHYVCLVLSPVLHLLQARAEEESANQYCIDKTESASEEREYESIYWNRTHHDTNVTAKQNNVLMVYRTEVCGLNRPYFASVGDFCAEADIRIFTIHGLVCL